MNEKVLRTLEYNKIIGMLANKANSAPGKKLCRELVPSTDLGEIRRSQRQTADALRRLFRFGSTSFGNNKDLGYSIRSLEVGSTLSILELLNIASCWTMCPASRPMAGRTGKKAAPGRMAAARAMEGTAAMAAARSQKRSLGTPWTNTSSCSPP